MGDVTSGKPFLKLRPVRIRSAHANNQFKTMQHTTQQLFGSLNTPFYRGTELSENYQKENNFYRRMR